MSRDKRVKLLEKILWSEKPDETTNFQEGVFVTTFDGVKLIQSPEDVRKETLLFLFIVSNFMTTDMFKHILCVMEEAELLGISLKEDMKTYSNILADLYEKRDQVDRINRTSNTEQLISLVEAIYEKLMHNIVSTAEVHEHAISDLKKVFRIYRDTHGTRLMNTFFDQV
jgi:hypothetical protein